MMNLVCSSCNSCVQSISKSFLPKPLAFNPLTRPFSMVVPSVSKKIYFTSSNKEAAIHETFDFDTYFAQKVNFVNQALVNVVPEKEPQKIHDSMRYSLLSNGKRVLPAFCFATCEIVGGHESIAMPAAVAIEMIVTMAFVHDDLPCSDNDDIRRGKAANHKVFGEGTALFSGVALLALAFEHMTNTPDDVPASRIVRAVKELAKVVGSEGICGGQVADLETSGLVNASMEQVDFVHLHKSAAFFVGVAAIGAILGGGSDEQIETIKNYARCVGRIFQVVDDILDEGIDTVDDKATYPKLVGIEKSWEYVKNLTKEANDHLAGFDQEKAAPLISFTHYLATRPS